MALSRLLTIDYNDQFDIILIEYKYDIKSSLSGFQSARAFLFVCKYNSILRRLDKLHFYLVFFVCSFVFGSTCTSTLEYSFTTNYQAFIANKAWRI